MAATSIRVVCYHHSPMGFFDLFNNRMLSGTQLREREFKTHVNKLKQSKWQRRRSWDGCTLHQGSMQLLVLSSPAQIHPDRICGPEEQQGGLWMLAMHGLGICLPMLQQPLKYQQQEELPTVPQHWKEMLWKPQVKKEKSILHFPTTFNC